MTIVASVIIQCDQCPAKETKEWRNLKYPHNVVEAMMDYVVEWYGWTITKNDAGEVGCTLCPQCASNLQ